MKTYFRNHEEAWTFSVLLWCYGIKNKVFNHIGCGGPQIQDTDLWREMVPWGLVWQSAGKINGIFLGHALS